ncbi:hypothetical protein HDU97_008932 [Phlyctochytrium planicorne]|nr:hypothetical protein HDU97_008932 [Phlyctochytrium planicorne]
MKSLPQSVVNAFAHCQNLVRTSDWENYMATLFLPPFPRHAAWAIRAFNVEIASIRDHLKASGSAGVLPGRMRMQFWKDNIDDLFKGTVREHPVLKALATTLEYTELSQSWFKRVLKEREQDLDDQPYHTIADLEKYGENTASALLYLQLEASGIRSTQIDHLASHIGKAMTITTLLRSTPVHLSNRKMCIPSEIMAKHRIPSEDMFRDPRKHAKAFGDAVLDVATVANNHLTTTRAHVRDMRKEGQTIPPEVLAMLLHGTPTDMFLNRLEKTNFNVLDGRLGAKNWKVPFVLWYRHRGGNF